MLNCAIETFVENGDSNEDLTREPRSKNIVEGEGCNKVDGGSGR